MLFGLYACVFDTGHCLPSEKQMIYSLGVENWLIKISFQRDISNLLGAKSKVNILDGCFIELAKKFSAKA